MDQRWDKSKPPQGPFALNKDCPQAQGLVAWWPMGPHASGARVFDLVGGIELAAGTAGTATLDAAGAPGLRLIQASSQYLLKTTTVVTGVPLSIGGWFSSVDTSTQCVMAVTDYDASNTNHCRIALVAGKVWAISANSSALSDSAQTTISYATGTPQHALATYSGTSNRTIYLNGANAVSSAIGISQGSFDRVSLGATVLTGPTPGQFFNGVLGEQCIWNVAVSPTIAAILADPGRRFELWYPLRSRKWFTQGASTAPTLSALSAINVTATSAQPRMTYTF